MSLAVEIPVDDRFVGLVRHVAGQAARRADLSEEQVGDVKVAVTEIVANAMSAQARSGSSEPIRVEIEIGDTLEIAVFDRGDGIDAAAQEVRVGDAGLGLVITRALVDELRFAARDGGGLRVVIALGRGEDEG